MTPELMEECADWIAEQLEEESMWVDAGLIQLILVHEWQESERIPQITHDEASTRLLQRLADAGVQGVPDAIDARLIRSVLEWEDEFLALAGRAR